jgi:hypothetical protein
MTSEKFAAHEYTTVASNYSTTPYGFAENVTSLWDTTNNVTSSKVTSDASHKSYVTWQIGKWILLVYRPMIGVTGVVGNILTLAVIFNSSLKNSPTSVYMVRV